MMNIYKGIFILLFLTLIFSSSLITYGHEGGTIVELNFTPGQLESLKNSVAPLMAMDDEAILALISDKAPLYEMMDPTTRIREGKLKWDISEPEALYSAITGEKVWPNTNYFSGVDKVKNPLGHIQEYPYYMDEAGHKYYLEGARDALIREYFFTVTPGLSYLYHYTKDMEYARKVALVLARYAQVYPGYPVSGPKFQSDGFGQVTFFTTPPYPLYRAGKLTDWYCNEIPKSFVIAYDFIKESGVLEELSCKMARDVHQDIKNFFRGTVKYVIEDTQPLEGHNVDPYVFERLILVGRTLNEPVYIKKALELTVDFISKAFTYDRFYPESPSYARQVVGTLEDVKNALERYEAAYGELFEDMRIYERAKVELNKAADALARMTYPDGSLAVTGDTWPYKKYYPEHQMGESFFLPGYGYAILERGKGENLMQAHLNFSLKLGHSHSDALGIIIWAKGKEFTGDIGYTYLKYRPWTQSALSHNTVLIDGKTQERGMNMEGTLVSYDASAPGFQVVEARAETAYPSLADLYRRAIILIDVDEADAYIVDIFQVARGTWHDWVVHGSADEDSKIVNASLNFSDRSGTLSVDGKPFDAQYGAFDSPHRVSEYYGLISNLKYACTDESWSLCFRGNRPSSPSLRLHMMAQEDVEVYIGRSPSVRLAKEDPRRADRFFRPTIVVRRQGEELKSTFVGIWEPYDKNPFIEEVKEFKSTSGDGLLLKIKCQLRDGNFIDYIFYGRNTSEPQDFEADGSSFQFQGRFARVRMDDKGIISLNLIEGKTLKMNQELLMETPGKFQGALLASGYDEASGRWYFDVEGHPQVGYSVKDQLIRATNEGGRTFVTYGDTLELMEDSFRVWLKDSPGFTYQKGGNLQETSYPRRTLPGDIQVIFPISVNFKKR